MTTCRICFKASLLMADNICHECFCCDECFKNASWNDVNNRNPKSTDIINDLKKIENKE